MRLTDVIYAFPDLLFYIIMMITLRDTVLGQLMNGLLLLFIALAVVSWVGVARLVRGQVLSLKNKEFVEAARCIGSSDTRIMARHILPNCLSPLVVWMAFAIPRMIIAEAVLGYLGIGLRPATDPKAIFITSWGVLVVGGPNGDQRPALAAAGAGHLCGPGGDGLYLRRRRPARCARPADAGHDVGRRGSHRPWMRPSRGANRGRRCRGDVSRDTDGDLICRSRQGDLAAFEALYEGYKGQVFRTALAITRDQAAAEDILQECFIRLHRALESLDESQPLAPWLYRVTVNLCYSWMTRQRRWLHSLEEARGVAGCPAPAIAARSSSNGRRSEQPSSRRSTASAWTNGSRWSSTI